MQRATVKMFRSHLFGKLNQPLWQVEDKDSAEFPVWRVWQSLSWYFQAEVEARPRLSAYEHGVPVNGL